MSARLGLAGIPSISESTLIARDASLAGYEGGRIHIQHLSARESVEAVAEAKARGVRITAEASPHHLTLTDDALLERLDTRLKMNPPLRAEDDRQALIAGLRDGTIDCIATDHAPHAREEKEVPFEEAPMGTTGLETAFAAVYTELVVPGRAAAGAGRRAALVGRRARRAAAAEHHGRGGGELLPRGPRAIWESGKPDTRAARRTAASRAGPCTGACSRRSPPARSPTASARSPSWGPREPARARRAALVVVDVQEGFRSYEAFESMAAACGRLVEGARILGVPMVATAQYPKGLGPVVPEVGLGEDVEPVEKTVFSAARADGLRPGRARPGDRVRDRGAHLRLADRARPAGARRRGPPGARRGGLAAIPGTSRSAWRRWTSAGAVTSSVETALFELCGAAGTDEFKAVQKVIK